MPALAVARSFTIATALRRQAAAVSGFSIVELMVTLAVAGILLSVAVPSFNRLTVNSRLTTTTNDVVGALNFARSEAIKRNTSITFCRVRSGDQNDCETAAGVWTNWLIRTAGGNVVRRGVINTFGNGIAVRSTLTSDQVVYGPEGLARTGGALVANQRITVCASRTEGRRVTLGTGSRLFTRNVTASCGA